MLGSCRATRTQCKSLHPESVLHFCCPLLNPIAHAEYKPTDLRFEAGSIVMLFSAGILAHNDNTDLWPDILVFDCGA